MEAARNLQTEKAVIVLAGIGPKKDGWKTRGIKDSEGEWWNVPEADAGSLRIGMTYHVEFVRTPKGYRNIENIVPAAAAPAETGQPQQNGKKMDYWSPKPRDPQERMEIWVNSMLGREIEMGRGFMSEDQLVARALIHKNVYGRVFGDKANVAD